MDGGYHTNKTILSNFKPPFAVDWSKYKGTRWNENDDTKMPLAELPALAEQEPARPDFSALAGKSILFVSMTAFESSFLAQRLGEHVRPIDPGIAIVALRLRIGDRRGGGQLLDRRRIAGRRRRGSEGAGRQPGPTVRVCLNLPTKGVSWTGLWGSGPTTHPSPDH